MSGRYEIISGVNGFSVFKTVGRITSHIKTFKSRAAAERFVRRKEK